MKTALIAPALLLLGLSACNRGEAPERAASARPTSGHPRPAAPTAKPDAQPRAERRVIELEGGVRVEVLVEGQGEVVAPGDEVALSLTLSYVPRALATPDAGAESASAVASDAASGAASGASQSDTEQGHTAQRPQRKPPATAPVEPAPELPPLVEAGAIEIQAATDGSTVPVEAGVPAADTQTTPDAGAATVAGTTADETRSTGTALDTGTATETGASSATDATPNELAMPAADAEPVDADSAGRGAAAEAAPAEPTGPPPSPLAAPLEPVILVSTRESGAPIRARVGAQGALVPGLSRALVGLRAGTVAEITIPADSAYGADGLASAGVPPATTLQARVEIREVRR